MKCKPCLALLLAVLLLSACAPPPPVSPDTPASQPENPAPAPDNASEPGLLEQMDRLYQRLDSSILPVSEEIPFFNYVDFSDEAPDYLPPQLVLDEPDAYRLSQQIRNVLYFNGNILHDFTDIEDAYRPALLQTALYHTPAVQFSLQRDSDSGRVYSEEHPDHVITYLMKHEIEAGRSPSEVFYASDVRDMADRLFGPQADYIDQDVGPYRYFEKQGVYVRMGDFGGPMWPYPQITNYTATDDGYVCEAVIISALAKDLPLEEDGVELTSENFEAATSHCPKYRYTFRFTRDGSLRLAGIESLSPQAENTV